MSDTRKSYQETELDYFYPSSDPVRTGPVRTGPVRTGSDSVNQISEVKNTLKYMYSIFQLIQKGLKSTSFSKEFPISEEVYRKIVKPLSAILTGANFFLARDKANVQQNSELTELICIMLSMLTYHMLNNKFRNIIMSGSPKTAMSELYMAYSIFNASKSLQLSIRNKVPQLQEACQMSSASAKTEKAEDSLRHFYP